MSVLSVLGVLGLPPGQVRRVEPLGRGHGGDHNANWRVWPVAGDCCVLRCYHRRTRPDDLAYEHAVLRWLAAGGWTVPVPLGDAVEWQSRWWCLMAFVPGRARRPETPAQRRQRGTDLARLQVTLRPSGSRLGQRPGWRAQHEGTTVHTDLDLEVRAGWSALAGVAPRLADWFAAAVDGTRARLAALGVHDLPVTVVHGDFHEGNVHYDPGTDRLAGVIDLGLTHLDSRPYELAIARSYRSPELRDAYRAELARQGWPLSPLEEAAIEPVDHAFRVDMAAWQLAEGLRLGSFATNLIERHLSRTAVPRP